MGAAVGLAFRCNLFGLQRVRVSLSLPATADAGVGQRCVPWYMLAVAKLTRSAAGLYVPPDRCLVTQVPAAVTRFLSHTASRLSLGSHRSPPTLPDGPTIDNAGGSEVRPWVPCYEVTGPVICCLHAVLGKRRIGEGREACLIHACLALMPLQQGLSALPIPCTNLYAAWTFHSTQYQTDRKPLT